jgi:hypothetical protein
VLIVNSQASIHIYLINESRSLKERQLGGLLGFQSLSLKAIG